jgi:hypothetical protein
MKKISVLYLITIFVFYITITSALLAEDNLTVEQLIELMKASSNQYTSIDAKMRATSYQKTDEKSLPKIKMIRQITCRCSNDRSYWQIEQSDFRNDATNQPEEKKSVTTYSATSQWTKYLVEEQGKLPRGTMRAGGIRNEDQNFYNIYLALWENCGWLWGGTKLHKVSLNYDNYNNLYILEIQVGSNKGPIHKFYVDSEKDFIPSKRESFANDGTLIIRFQCEEFRLINNLWIPYRYSWFDPGANYKVVYEVEDLAVNEPIADDLLDFEFPVGTIVRDKILNLRYKIEDVNQPQSFVVDPCSKSLTTVLSTPVEEEALLAAASKAKVLLEAKTSTEAKTSQIEVSPLTVLVTTDKYEYKLSVKKDGDTKPVLLNYKFESAELELTSLKNVINTDDRLIVSINRLKSHTGFASCTLFLSFEGENKPVEVRFVSAPLSNPS